MSNRIAAILALGCLISYWPAPASAESANLAVMPLIGPDRAPSIELQNLTKMPVRLDAATLTFAAAAGTQPCTLRLGAPVDIGLAAVALVRLAESNALADCLRARAGPQTRPDARVVVVTERDLARPAPRRTIPDSARLQPADLEFSYVVGGMPARSSARWHFALE